MMGLSGREGVRLVNKPESDASNTFSATFSETAWRKDFPLYKLSFIVENHASGNNAVNFQVDGITSTDYYIEEYDPGASDETNERSGAPHDHWRLGNVGADNVAFGEVLVGPGSYQNAPTNNRPMIVANVVSYNDFMSLRGWLNSTTGSIREIDFRTTDVATGEVALRGLPL